MKPFLATYQKLDYAGRKEGDPEMVLVLSIIAPKPYSTRASAVFVHSDGRLDQDEIDRFTDCLIERTEIHPPSHQI